MKGLRQSWAALLLVAFSAPLISPLVSAKAEPPLPPCCRRDGKHRCAMMTAATGASDLNSPALRNGKAKCPLYPSGKAISAFAAAGLPPAIFATLAHRVTTRLKAPSHRANWRSLESRSAPKRGPPSLST